MTLLSITTDYCNSLGNGRDYLRLISEAGFTHVHWCQHFADDYIYSSSEIAAIKGWLHDYGLRLLDLHGSHGTEKHWWALEEYERQAGVELVVNRTRMFRELEGEGCLIMHPCCFQSHAPDDAQGTARDELIKRQYTQLLKSIEELEPVLRRENVRLACENFGGDTYWILDDLLQRFPPGILGLTYDSGHGNLLTSPAFTKQLDQIAKRTERLYALHLNDNNEYLDQHQPPYYGTVDWDRLLRIIAKAPHVAQKPLQFEITMRCTPYTYFTNPSAPPEDAQRAYLKDAYVRCMKIAQHYEYLTRINK